MNMYEAKAKVPKVFQDGLIIRKNNLPNLLILNYGKYVNFTMY